MFKQLALVTIMLATLLTGVSGLTSAGSAHAAAPATPVRVHRHALGKRARA